MSFIKKEGDTAILRQNGVYKEVDLYTYNEGLFAQVSGGFVRLNANGGTSKTGLQVDVLKIEAPLFVDRFGRLCTQPGDGRTPALAQANGEIKLLPA